jgi:hypothetical protein
MDTKTVHVFFVNNFFEKSLLLSNQLVNFAL